MNSFSSIYIFTLYCAINKDWYKISILWQVPVFLHISCNMTCNSQINCHNVSSALKWTFLTKGKCNYDKHHQPPFYVVYRHWNLIQSPFISVFNGALIDIQLVGFLDCRITFAVCGLLIGLKKMKLITIFHFNKRKVRWDSYWLNEFTHDLLLPTFSIFAVMYRLRRS